MAALATAADLATLLRRTFSAADTAAANLILDGVSASIRTFTHQYLSLVTGESLVVDVDRCRRRLWLPELPIVAVTSITVDGGLVPATSYRVDVETGEVKLSSIIGTWGTATAFDPRVTIVYSHGFATIPDVAHNVCLSATARAFYNPEGTIAPADGSGGATAGRNLAGSLTADEEKQLASLKLHVVA